MVNDKFFLGNRPLHPEIGNDCRIPGFIEKSNIVKLHFVCDNFLGPRRPLVEPSISPPVPSATIFPELIDEL